MRARSFDFRLIARLRSFVISIISISHLENSFLLLITLNNYNHLVASLLCPLFNLVIGF